MRVLVATLIRRDKGRVYQYPQATESILALRFDSQVDYFMPSGGDDDEQSIYRKYEQARAWALWGCYDALLCAESDMLLPVDALERLAAVHADVVYGLYTFRKYPHQWNVTTKLDRFSLKFISNEPDRARAAWGQVITCDGVGQGCTLIKRAALEAIPFRYHPSAGVDHLFSFDAKTCGLTQAADCGCICGHITGDNVVYPTNEGELWRMQALLN